MAKSVTASYPPEYIFSSTLKRARETANVLSGYVNCNVEYTDELMEFDNGVQAGLNFEEGKKLNHPVHIHDRFEGGESHIEFRMRIESFLSKAIHTTSFTRIAIVAHGGVINNLLRSFF